MKRSILLAVLTLFVAVNASAQRKVLIEEFTSSTCGPCAGTDPLMEEFEEAYHDKIVVLKYHQNYPAAGDIMYDAYPEGFERGNLYGVHQTGIPWVQFNGVTNKNPGYGLDTLTSITDRVMDLSSVYYNLGVTQAIVGDSIIVNVTVNAGAQVDPNARLVVAIAEANVLHQGSNRRYYHTAAVRTLLPGIEEDGSPNGPALTVAENGQASFRYAAHIKESWNRGLLQVVAFVQNPTSRMVMGVETTKPDVFLTRKGATASVVGTQTDGRWAIHNMGSTSQSVRVFSELSSTNPYTISVRTADGRNLSSTDTVIVGPGEEREILVKVTSAGATTAIQLYSLSLATAEVGITGGGGLAWGKDNKTIFVDAGVGGYAQTYQGVNGYLSALNTAKMPSVYLTEGEIRDGFANFSNFENIFWAASYSVGLFTDTGDTNNVRNFIANGGNFVMSSMTFAGVYAQAQLESYVEEVFGATVPRFADEQWSDLIGVAGDPIGKGLGESSPIAVSNMLRISALEPSSLNSTAAAAFRNENDDIVAVHAEHEGGGKTVLLSFEPGNITSTTSRRAVIKAIVDWLNSTGSVSPVTEKNGIVLKQNFPNPFNPGTTIGFELPESGRVTLKVQDMMGREIATVLENEYRAAGENVAHFDASDLTSGNYIYVLTVNGQRLERKMTLAK